MDRFLRCGLLIALNCGVLFAAALAPAQQSPLAPERDAPEVSVRLEYPVWAAGCASPENFEARVRSRLSAGWPARPEDGARVLRVAVAQSAERYLAEISFRDARDQRVARSVTGKNCDQVVDGIALITALAIQALLEDRPENVTSATPPNSPSADAQQKKLETAPPTRPPTPGNADLPPRVRQQKARAAANSGTFWPERLRLGGRGVVQSAAGPGLALGGGGFAGAEWRSFTLGVALDASQTGTTDASGVPTRFHLLAARLETCLHWSLSGTRRQGLALEPCATAQAGSLRGQASRAPPLVTVPAQGSAWWLASGALIGLSASLEAIFLRLEGGASLVLRRERFYVDVAGASDPQVIYRVSAVAASAALAAGVVF